MRKIALALILFAAPLTAQTYQMTGTTPIVSTPVSDNYSPALYGYNFTALADTTYHGLCRWNVPGNTQLHNVYLYDGTLQAVVWKVAIDTTKGAPGAWQCAAATGSLVLGHAYAVVSSESPADQIVTFSSTVFDPAVGANVQQTYFMSDPPIGGAGYGNPTNQSLGPVNLEMTAPPPQAATPLLPGTAHTLTLGGIRETAGSDVNTTFFALTDVPPSMVADAARPGGGMANTWTGNSMDVVLDGVSMICAYTPTSYAVGGAFTWNCAVPLALSSLQATPAQTK